QPESRRVADLSSRWAACTRAQSACRPFGLTGRVQGRRRIMSTVKQLNSEEIPVVLTPEQVVQQLRSLRGQIPNARPLTNDERELARKQVRLGLSPEAVQASVNAIGSSEGMAPAVGISAGEARQLMDENTRWSAVEDELKGLLTGVA